MKFILIIGKLFIATAVIYFYYKWIKQLIFHAAPNLAKKIGLTKKYPVMAAAGVVQLFLIALSHIIFCIALFFLLQIKSLGLLSFSPPLLLWGFVIGVGAMGLSTVFCQIGMLIGQVLFPKYVPTNAKNWLTIARGGWMRHHLHNVEILPFGLALVIILMQISSEEIVFRGIMLNFFMDAGKVGAILISTLLFVAMQVFHMSSRASAMFPVLGALVLGVVNGILYVHTPMLLPLIIAHLAFFIVAVL